MYKIYALTNCDGCGVRIPLIRPIQLCLNKKLFLFTVRITTLAWFVEVNAETATTHPESVDDIIVLPCKHVYHYTCLRNTCIYNNPGTYAKECPLCRHKYTSFDVPTDDVYVPYFHKKKTKDTTKKYQFVDWNYICFLIKKN